MAKEIKAADRYGDVVQRLEEVVRRLEGGELTLEDSLKDFEEGVKLVRKGEALLNEAERRIEQLLSDGSVQRSAPQNGKTPSPEVGSPAGVEEAEDIPF